VTKTKRFLSYVGWIALAVLAPGIIFGGFLSGFFFNPRVIDEYRMEEIFVEDYELLTSMVQFLVDTGHDNVFITWDMPRRGEMSVSGGIRVEIEDADVVELVQNLRRRGYSSIGKSGNTINFLRWPRRNHFRGIAFSLDGEEPTVDYLTRLVPLSQMNWYYYEADFNLWRHQNQTPLGRQGDCSFVVRNRNFCPRTGHFTQSDPFWGVHNMQDAPLLLYLCRVICYFR